MTPSSATELPVGSGPPDPCSTAVHMEPFSTSVIKVLIWLLATTTMICTNDSSTRSHERSFNAYHFALLHATISMHHQFTVAVGYRWNAPAPSIFRAGWFGRWVVTHSLADFDFHDHRPAVYINQHLLWYLMSVLLGTLTWLSVHPASPVLLTKNGPLATHIRWQDSMLRETIISPI